MVDGLILLGAVHCGHLPGYPDITRDALIAVSRCSNLQSMTWIDDSSTENPVLFAFMNAIHSLPVRELTIRTLSDFGEKVWRTLKQRAGLRKLSLWCMDGPPRVLEGWSDILGDTLTHLELGVSISPIFLWLLNLFVDHVFVSRDVQGFRRRYLSRCSLTFLFSRT